MPLRISSLWDTKNATDLQKMRKELLPEAKRVSRSPESRPLKEQS
jgi:hypothetical protein